ncbi:MAG: hypothetical protein EON52_19045, partial [Actinomycetales bacterium]
MLDAVVAEGADLVRLRVLADGDEVLVHLVGAVLVAVSEDPEPDKIRAFCDDSVEHFNWVEALGFE